MYKQRVIILKFCILIIYHCAYCFIVALLCKYLIVRYQLLKFAFSFRCFLFYLFFILQPITSITTHSAISAGIFIISKNIKSKGVVKLGKYNHIPMERGSTMIKCISHANNALVNFHFFIDTNKTISMIALIT